MRSRTSSHLLARALALAIFGLAPILAAHAAANASSESSSTAATADPFVWAKKLATGRTLEVHGVHGDITAELASGNEARLEARKSGKKDDPDEVTIQVVEDGDAIVICAVYPDSDGRPGTDDCYQRGRHSHVHDNDVRVDFVVRVPAGVKFVAHTVNGDVAAKGLRAPVEAATVNGDVEISTTGLARATTVNGGIAARMGASALRGDLAFTTVNGPIYLEVPSKLDADVSASTLSGSIRTDFDLPVWTQFMNTRMSGTIGKGGPELTLTTVNGRIELASSR